MTEPAIANNNVTADRKRIRGRSPSYPGINLETAIKRAKVLYDKEGRHATPISLVAKHWGYKAHTTGPASVTYAALTKFGLLTDEGTGDARQAKVTDLAVKILMSPDVSERDAAIQEAALKPGIHAEMWNEYRTDLPTDEALRYKMAIQGPFTEAGFGDFIRVYRDTIAFAKLGLDDKPGSQEPDPAEDDDTDDAEKKSEHPPSRRTIKRQTAHERRVGMSDDVQTIAVPMLGAPPVIVEGRFPLSEDEWTYFMTVLNAMKTGLVGEPVSAGADE